MSLIVRLLHRLNGTTAIDQRLNDIKNRFSHDIKNLTTALAVHHDWIPYIGLNAPLFLLGDGRLAFNNEYHQNRPRIIVNSIPKSGTYLLAEILKNMGYIATGIHLWDTGFHDYRQKSIPEMIHNYAQFSQILPLQYSTALIMPGQFSVGHISMTTHNAETLCNFRKLIAVRDLRHVLVSYMRWSENEGRGINHPTDWKVIPNCHERMRAFLEYFGTELLHWAESIAGWTEAEDTLLVRFEALLGDYGVEAQHTLLRSLAEHIDLDLDNSALDAALATTLNTPTKTWSGSRTCLTDFWSEDCEIFFRKHGGLEINRSLNYK